MTAAPRQDLKTDERRALIARLLGNVETQARDLRIDFEQHTHEDAKRLDSIELYVADLEQEAADLFEELRRYMTQLRAAARLAQLRGKRSTK